MRKALPLPASKAEVTSAAQRKGSVGEPAILCCPRFSADTSVSTAHADRDVADGSTGSELENVQRRWSGPLPPGFARHPPQHAALRREIVHLVWMVLRKGRALPPPCLRQGGGVVRSTTEGVGRAPNAPLPTVKRERSGARASRAVSRAKRSRRGRCEGYTAPSRRA